MPRRLLHAALPALFACACISPAAYADMYTWTDASGRVNVSNIAPPEGARVSNVKHEAAPKPPPVDPERESLRQREMQAMADRARELEMMALAQRVHDLEREVQLAQLARAAPPVPMEAFPPRFISYQPDPPPPQPMYSGCDPSWAGCGWNTGYFPPTVVVVAASNHRRMPAYRGERERYVGPVRPMRGLPSSPSSPRRR